MVFRSSNPDINVPANVPLWTWLFESEHSILSHTRPEQIQGYTDVLTKEHLSYVDVKNYTTYLSTCLVKEYGLREGDVVTVFSKNSVWYPVAMLGAVRVGAVAAGASPEYNVDEMAYALKLSKARFIMTTAEFLHTAVKAAEIADIPQEHVFLLQGQKQGFTTLQDLCRKGKELGGSAQVAPYKISNGKTNADICGFLAFSSGTTGLPKAVMISQKNVIAQCLQVQQITPADHKKVLSALPFYHITGLVHQLHLPIVLNAHVYILSAFSMDKFLQTVSDHKIEELLIVPPILIRLVRERDTVSKYNLSHVKRFSSGAAPLSAEVLALLESQFPGTGFKQGYGMTESCSAITSHPPSKYSYKYSSRVGTVVASTEVKIVDPETGKECGVNEPGEIWARGPQMAMGYLDNPEATNSTFDSDGFLHTGDIGKIDEEGLLMITDRMKEMIKVKGIGVAPAELEDLLLGHDYVSDVAVVGIPNERSGEKPKAFVVLKNGLSVAPEAAAREVIQYSMAKKARHKWLDEVEVIDLIPKSPAGKILRRKLRDLSNARQCHARVKADSVKARL